MSQGSASNLSSHLRLRTQVTNVEENLNRSLSEVAHLSELIEEQERLATLGTMTAGIVHELKNAITPVAACASLLNATGENSSEVIDLVQASSNHASEVLHQFRHFFGNEHDDQDATEIVSWADVVERAITLTRFYWKNEAQQRGVEYHIQTSVAPDLCVAGNFTDLTQLVINLVMNAIEAMPGGGQVDIAGRRFGDVVELSVADQGIGLSGEGLGAELTPFFTTKRGGSGLGLIVCQRVVARHHGTLEVDAMESAGTRFVVRVPRTDQSHRCGSPVRLFNALQRGRVLVIDSDPSMRHLKSQVLNGLGFDVNTLVSLELAVEEVRNGAYQLVILDMPLPVPEIGEFITGWRQAVPQIAIVLVTGWPKPEVVSRLKSLDAEPNYIIEKPYGKKEIFACLESLFGQNGED